jgi:hypothetical protein
MSQQPQQQKVKPMEERLKESMTILRKLQGLGIPSDDPDYKILSSKFNTWIKGGPAFEGTIDFQPWNRRANLILPVKQGYIARCEFLHHVF